MCVNSRDDYLGGNRKHLFVFLKLSCGKRVLSCVCIFIIISFLSVGQHNFNTQRTDKCSWAVYGNLVVRIMLLWPSDGSRTIRSKVLGASASEAGHADVNLIAPPPPPQPVTTQSGAYSLSLTRMFSTFRQHSINFHRRVSPSGQHRKRTRTQSRTDEHHPASSI